MVDSFATLSWDYISLALLLTAHTKDSYHLPAVTAYVSWALYVLVFVSFSLKSLLEAAKNHRKSSF